MSKKEKVFQIGEKVFDTVHEAKGEIVDTYFTELEPDILIYTVKLENGDAYHLTEDQIKKQ